MELVTAPATLRVCDQSFAEGLTIDFLKAQWPTPAWYYAIWFVYEVPLPANGFQWCSGVRVTCPLTCYRNICRALAAGPGIGRARRRVLYYRIKRLHDLFGPDED